MRSLHWSPAAGAGADVRGAPAFLQGLSPRGLPASLWRWWRRWLACGGAEKREAGVAGIDVKLGFPSGLKALWGQRGTPPCPVLNLLIKVTGWKNQKYFPEQVGMFCFFHHRLGVEGDWLLNSQFLKECIYLLSEPSWIFGSLG